MGWASRWILGGKCSRLRGIAIVSECVWGDVGEVEWSPASDRPDEAGVWPSSVWGKREVGDTAQLAAEDGVCDLSTGPAGPEGGRGNGLDASSPALSVQAPSFPSLSAQAPSPRSVSTQVPPKGSPFDENCAGLEEPDGAQRDYVQ